jgi:hypothetical protein
MHGLMHEDITAHGIFNLQVQDGTVRQVTCYCTTLGDSRNGFASYRATINVAEHKVTISVGLCTI